ncbi:MAG: PD-(D/E)XK nuclease family protein, partial [Bacilli bacterium]|nr:PD-(D/E)XK nuclease family protein [Bacilli bacterium]
VRPSSDLKWHVSVSREYDRFIHAKLAYENKTYGKMSMRFHNLQALIGNDNEVYDPQFSGLSIASIDGLLGRKVTISPTSLGRFYQCPFSFLLGSILKIKPDQKTFTTYFGNLAHMVIESVYTEDDANYVEYLEACSNDMPEDHVYKQDILKKIVVDKLEAVRKAMIEFRKQGNFRVIGSEWSHEFDFWDDVRFRIKGKIDRIIAIKKNEDELIIVIDYKTGSQKFSKADFDEGINVQLPFYLYLFKKRHPEALYVPAGFFIQRLPLGRLDVEDDDTMTLSLKLNGWMLEDKHLFNSLGGSDWLEGIQLNNDEGFRKSERLLDRDTMTDLINKVDELISAAIHEIAAGKFPIKPMPPKPNQRISNSCKYCRFDSVCYLKSLGVALDRLEGSGDDEQI